MCAGVCVPFVRVDPEEGSFGSPNFFTSVPHSPPVKSHGLHYDLNLDRLDRHSGVGVRNTKMVGVSGGDVSTSGL